MLRIGLDVSSKSDFYNVMNSLWSHRPDSFYQFVTSEDNFACTRIAAHGPAVPRQTVPELSWHGDPNAAEDHVELDDPLSLR